MAINPVTSSSGSQAILPQPQSDQTRQAELARQARQAEQARQSKPAEETKAPPVVNTQGQTTGGTINTTA